MRLIYYINFIKRQTVRAFLVSKTPAVLQLHLRFINNVSTMMRSFHVLLHCDYVIKKNLNMYRALQRVWHVIEQDFIIYICWYTTLNHKHMTLFKPLYYVEKTYVEKTWLYLNPLIMLKKLRLRIYIDNRQTLLCWKNMTI